MAATDIDGDGDQDVLSASFYDNKVAWYENIDGTGSLGPQKTIDRKTDNIWQLTSADLDNDGDFDLIEVGINLHDEDQFFGRVVWYENVNSGETLRRAE